MPYFRGLRLCPYLTEFCHSYGGKEARAQGILNSTKNEAVALAADGKEMLSSAKDKVMK